MKSRKSVFAAVVLLVAAPAAALAQEAGGMNHSGMDRDGMAAMDAPSTKAFMAAMQGMRSEAMSMTGDPDLDFLRNMIPHHEGAVAMGKAELEYGADEQVKELARKVVADQQAEIELMRRMIAEREAK